LAISQLEVVRITSGAIVLFGGKSCYRFKEVIVLIMAKKSGIPVVGGEPYDAEDDFADSISRGIGKGIARRKARERDEGNAKESDSSKRRKE
jgi:hypothetical protein